MQPRQPAKGSLGGGAFAPSVPPFSSNPPHAALPEPRRGSPPPLQPVGAPMQMSSQFVRTPVVRYSSRMRVGRIHPLKVSLANNGVPSLGFQSSNPGTFDPPVVIQVTVPGAIVTPPHVIVPLAGGEANFYIQPLMAGKLVGGKVEFLSQGRKISEVALPMKANRGRLARCLFLLALILPFLINFFPDFSFTDKVRREPGPAVPEEKKAPKQLPASAGAEEGAALTKLVWIVPVSFPQPPKEAGKESKQDRKEPSSEGQGARVLKKGTSPTSPGKTDAPVRGEEPAKAGTPDSPATPSSTETTITYHGDDAIWAWVRSRLHQHGYPTKTLYPARPDSEPLGALGELLIVQRRYEITGDSPNDWNTGRAATVSLYHAEPVLRFLYRVFIVFPNPKNWPFGDVIYGLAFLTLAALVWLATNPNRRTIKGPVLNIHVGS